MIIVALLLDSLLWVANFWDKALALSKVEGSVNVATVTMVVRHVTVD